MRVFNRLQDVVREQRIAFCIQQFPGRAKLALWVPRTRDDGRRARCEMMRKTLKEALGSKEAVMRRTLVAPHDGRERSSTGEDRSQAGLDWYRSIKDVCNVPGVGRREVPIVKERLG